MALATASMGQGWAANHALSARLPNYDQRWEGRTQPILPSADQAAAARALTGRNVAGGGKVEINFDPLLASPKWIRARGGFLTGPGDQGRALSGKGRVTAPANDPDYAIKALLADQQTLFGHGPEVLEPARRQRDYVTAHNGMRTVVWEQQHEGIPVYEGVLIANLTKRGELVSLSSQFVPDAERAAQAGKPQPFLGQRQPAVSARAALLKALETLGTSMVETDLVALGVPSDGPEQRQAFQAGQLPDDAGVRLVWLPLTRDKLQLCWAVEVTQPQRGGRYRILVDGANGAVLLRRCLTFDLSDVTYRVYTGGSPAPMKPGLPAPARTQAPPVPRALVTLNALNTNASPLGWINDGDNETRGNNVDAHLDRDADNLPDLPRPQGTPFRIFDFPLDLGQPPANYSEAAVVQLFYWCNWIHDRLYELGFTEAAGNFQKDNFGRGGEGNDAVLADAQDGAMFNNANFTTRADGEAPRLQMFLFDGPNPWRDADLEAETIIHEYTHGLTDRLVGGGGGIGYGQDIGLAEGWSDFYALALLSEPADDVDGVYASGAYLTYRLDELQANYYFGIRRYPYSTDLSKNPLTFGDLYGDDVAAHPQVPRNPIISKRGTESHTMGEVWCSILWEMRANLVRQHGFAGNELALRLVTDSLKLLPAYPDFIQARDALLLADEISHGGAHAAELWQAFAKRGLGYGAYTQQGYPGQGFALEAFDLPGSADSAGTNSLAQLFTDGSFSLDHQTLTFTPDGSSNYYRVCRAPAGPLPTDPAGGAVVALDDDAYRLVTLTNGATLSLFGARTNRFYIGSNGDVILVPPAYYTYNPITGLYTEYFHAGWDAFTERVRLGILYADLNPGDSGTVSWKQLPDRVAITYDRVPEYGSRTNNTCQMEIFFDGVIRFTYQTVTVTNAIVGLSRGLGLAANFVERNFNTSDSCYPPIPLLAPPAITEGSLAVTGTISLAQALPQAITLTLQSSDASTMAVTPSVVIPAGQTSALFAITVPDDVLLNGTRRVVISGSAAGLDVTPAIVEVRDNETAVLTVTLPALASEGDGPLPGQGRLHLSARPAAPIEVRLSSSNPNLVGVPETATIAAGETAAAFDLLILDNPDFNLTETVTVRAIVSHWTDGVAALEVRDNESRRLGLVLHAQISEAAGTLTGTARVELAATLPTNLVVNLASSLPNLVSVPEVVTVSAGERSVPFSLTVSNDQTTNGTRMVTITATPAAVESGFLGTNAVLLVRDDEGPLAPAQPQPPDQASGIATTNHLSWTSETVAGGVAEPVGATVFEVYFGTNPVPGLAELVSRNSATNWIPPQLALGTTYYWRVVAEKGGLREAGPVWQFTTANLGGFELMAFPTNQWAGVPFEITLVAKEEHQQRAQAFDGAVAISALVPGPAAASVVITEVGLGTVNQVEFANVSSRAVDVSGWEVALYDWAAWPDPKVVFTLPEGSLCPAGGTFVLRSSSPPFLPGEYPIYYLGAELRWNHHANQNALAVLLRDRSGLIMDFMCAADANPAQIRQPVAIPALEWQGPPVPPNILSSNTYQRVGNTDGNRAADWTSNKRSFGSINANLSLPFTGLRQGNVIPSLISSFVQGAWTGPVSLLTAETNLWLRFDDGHGHVLTSGVFRVEATHDLAISFRSSPARPTVGNLVAISLTVTNRGSAPATEVVLTNYLPAGLTLVSNQTTQGACTALVDKVICALGTLVARATAVVTLDLRPTALGNLTNLAMVRAAESEPDLANNAVAATVAVQPPWLFISSASVWEGNSGVTSLVFPVRLSDPSPEIVTVRYFTSNGTAMAGSDFQAVTATLVIPPGLTNTNLVVLVHGDTLIESNEIFFVQLAQASNALLATALAIGGITNDDSFIYFNVADATVTEGNSGTTQVLFTVSLETDNGLPEVSGMPITLQYQTTDDTARAGLDYLPVSGRLTFLPGVITQSVAVTVLGDTDYESNKTFSLDITSAVGALARQARGTGTILDDDAGQLHHFGWGLASPTQQVNAPFSATLTALDAQGGRLTNFTGTVALQAGQPGSIVTLGTGTNTWAYPLGTGYHDGRLQVIYPADEVGQTGRIWALALEVSRLPAQTLSNWTIRLKHTPQPFYQAPMWENSGWTTVYQADETIVTPGWVGFVLHTPFEYNGTNHLMADFSFNNASFSDDGLCRATLANQLRAIGCRTDSAFGDPVTWTATSGPSPVGLQQFPNVRLFTDQPVAVLPSHSGLFVNGVWTGDLSLLRSASNVVFRVQDGHGHFGVSAPLQVIVADADGDGLPDEWERAHGLNPNEPADAAQDADQDGLSNWGEFLAGTDPQSSNSVLRLTLAVDHGAGLRLSFPTVSGKSYQIESVTRPGGVWTPKSALLLGDGQMYWLTLPAWEGASQCYRLKLVP